MFHCFQILNILSYTVLLSESQARMLLTVKVPRLRTVLLLLSSLTTCRNCPALPSLTRALTRKEEGEEEEEEKTGLTRDQRALSWLIKT